MTALSPRTQGEALAWARAQVVNRSQDWTNYCQKFVHDAYGIPALFSSAYAQWLGADPADRFPGGNIDDAPVGSALCFKGVNPFGHIDLAAHPFQSGNTGAFSNDLLREGYIDKVHRDAPITVWGHRYLGYLTAVNGYDLQLHKPHAHPVPKQQVPYRGIEAAITALEGSLATAGTQHDPGDVKALRAEVGRLKKMYGKLRRNA